MTAHEPAGVQANQQDHTYAARCSCGWRGARRYSEIHARADFQNHKTRAAVQADVDTPRLADL